MGDLLVMWSHLRTRCMLIDQAGFPDGVLQLVNGGKDTVNALLDHPTIKVISFVCSTPVAMYVYGRATGTTSAHNARAEPRNPVVIMPDADMESVTSIVADSAWGCAGQRCLALSVAVTVGEAKSQVTELLADAVISRSVGYGLDDGTEMGAVITADSKERIRG